jgi:hypothetical protein
MSTTPERPSAGAATQWKAIALTALGLLAAIAATLGVLLYLRANSAPIYPIYPRAISTPALPHPTTTHRSGQFTVNAQLYWQDTSYYVQAGDHVVITYLSGLWSYSPAQPLSDGNGPPEQFICTEHFSEAQCSNATGYGVPDAVQGSLVGRITPMEPLKIGDHLDFVAQQSGELELAINDGYNEDNRGAITVQITVS